MSNRNQSVLKKLKIAPDALKRMLNVSRCKCGHVRGWHKDQVTSRQHNDGRCEWPQCPCNSYDHDSYDKN